MAVSHVRVRTPVRICDVGGWSDTWFAGHGRVCSIAVQPGVCVDIRAQAHGVDVQLGNEPMVPASALCAVHPLLSVALAEIPPPHQSGWHIHISADMPPGCATGTSAAVSVALLSALARLHQRTLSPAEAARRAHALETKRLGLQSGIQDQIGAAFGGINDIVMHAYSRYRRNPFTPTASTITALNDQLQLWYLGRPHSSSQVHEEVIKRFETVPAAQALLDPLRTAAYHAVTAIQKGDLRAYGDALQRNTDAQRALHPALVCADAETLITLVAAAGALGWKVNGAGGDGGSVAILWPDAATAQHQLTSIQCALPQAQHIPIHVSMAGISYEICTEEAQ
ncbi:MAG: GHMP kinase [Roseiflexaceae bacterium]